MPRGNLLSVFLVGLNTRPSSAMLCRGTSRDGAVTGSSRVPGQASPPHF